MAKKHGISLKTGRLHTDNFRKEHRVNLKKGDDETRVPSGVIGLDRMIKGGFEKNSINLVTGGVGAGKSIFGMQFLMEGIKKGESGIYITFEETKNNIYKHMLSLGWDLKKHEGEGNFKLLQYRPGQIKDLLSEGGGLVEITASEIKARRIVIDSLTAFALLFKGDLERRESFLDLFRVMSSWGCTALLIVEHETDLRRMSPLAIEFEADSVILLYNIRQKDVRTRALEILKMRGIKHANKLFPMKITDNGIMIFENEEVF